MFEKSSNKIHRDVYVVVSNAILWKQSVKKIKTWKLQYPHLKWEGMRIEKYFIGKYGKQKTGKGKFVSIKNINDGFYGLIVDLF